MQEKLKIYTLISTFENLPDTWGMEDLVEFRYSKVMKDLYLDDFPKAWEEESLRQTLGAFGVNDYANKWKGDEFACIEDTELRYLLEWVDSGLAEGVRVDGKIKGIPLAGGNHQLLFFNKKFVPEAPATFAEMVEMARKFKNESDMEFPLMFPTACCYFILPMLYSYGSPLWSDDPGAKMGVTRDSLFKTVTLLKSLIYEEKLSPVKWEMVDSVKAFREGKAAFCIGGDWDLTGHYDTLGDALGVSAIPPIEGSCRSTRNANYLFVSQHLIPELYPNAAALAERILSPDVQKQLSDQLHRFPAAKSVNLADLNLSEVDQASYRVFSDAFVLPPLKEVSHMYHVFAELLEPDVLINRSLEELTDWSMMCLADLSIVIEIKR